MASKVYHLKCPECGTSGEMVVVDSRPMPHPDLGLVVKRRRKCHACNVRWNTYEVHAVDVDGVVGRWLSRSKVKELIKKLISEL